MATFYYCSVCGNMFETICDSGITPECCGEPMEKLQPASTDGAGEKHVPVYKLNKNVLVVNIGEFPHPMEKEHYIEWVVVCTDHGSYRKKLCPGDLPQVTFLLTENEHPKHVYAYCNIHGLWEAN